MPAAPSVEDTGTIGVGRLSPRVGEIELLAYQIRIDLADAEAMKHPNIDPPVVQCQRDKPIRLIIRQKS